MLVSAYFSDECIVLVGLINFYSKLTNIESNSHVTAHQRSDFVILKYFISHAGTSLMNIFCGKCDENVH